MQCSLPLTANSSLCAGADLLPLSLYNDSGQASLPALPGCSLPSVHPQHHTVVFVGTSFQLNVLKWFVISIFLQ